MTGEPVYVVNGGMAAEALVASGRAPREHVLVLHDVLSCGALPYPDPEPGSPSWQASREAFWREIWFSATSVGWLEAPFAGFFDRAANLYGAGRTLRSAKHLVVCAGSGLSDVLCLAFVVEWTRRLGVGPGRLAVARMTASPGALPPVCVPHLTPAEIADRFRPETLARPEASLLREFWRFWVGRDVAGLSALRAADPAPWLEPALGAWLRRVPGPQRQLAAWDERLLAAARAPGATLGSVVGGVLRAAAGDADPVGDLVLLHRLVGLASSGSAGPWVGLGETRGRETPCRVTASGRALLDGKEPNRDPERTWAWARGLAAA